MQNQHSADRGDGSAVTPRNGHRRESAHVRRWCVATHRACDQRCRAEKIDLHGYAWLKRLADARICR